MRDDSSADCILVGGGLANSLIALALRGARPELRVKMIERGDRVGGNHTWSFHSTDFDVSDYGFVRPLIVRSWESQEVRFPGYARTLATRYNTISSSRVHEAVSSALGRGLILNAEAAEVTAAGVTLADGRRIAAPCVIDGRGAAGTKQWDAGFQKFLGLEVELENPHALERPIIMDATVEQIDGYRFVYSLPFEERRLLIEDTYYSNSPVLDKAALEARVKAYAAAKGWRIARILRRESGVLPIVLSGGIGALWDAAPGAEDVPRAGVRAVMFNPTTGYSLPDAARLAQRLSALENLTSDAAAKLVRALSGSLWEERSFFRLLNRLMFVAAEPHQRLKVMKRFYTLPEPLIRRFYACELTFMDKARILTGKPPISFFRALNVVRESSAA
jgi:lycopene beta-cyclase